MEHYDIGDLSMYQSFLTGKKQQLLDHRNSLPNIPLTLIVVFAQEGKKKLLTLHRNVC